MTVRIGGDVRVLEPGGLAKLRSGASLQLDGEPGDGQVEVYPLVVEVVEVEDAASATLRVEVHDQVIERVVKDLRETSNDRYRLEEEVALYDFPDDEESITITAELTDDGTTQRDVVEPVVLRLGYECNWTARIDGHGSWSGDAAIHVPSEGPGDPIFQLAFEYFGESRGRTVAMAITDGPGPAPGETGTFVIASVTVLDLEGAYVWSGTDAELSIVENGGDRMTGSLTASMEGTNTKTGEQTSGSLVIDLSSGTGNPPCSDPTDSTQ